MKLFRFFFAPILIFFSLNCAFSQNCYFNSGIKTDKIGDQYMYNDQTVEVCAGTKVGLIADSLQYTDTKFQWKKIGNYGGVENVKGATYAK